MSGNKTLKNNLCTEAEMFNDSMQNVFEHGGDCAAPSVWSTLVKL